MKHLQLLLLLLCFLSGYNAADILAVFQSPGRSQWVLGEAYLKGLSERGHHITVFTTFPTIGSPANWTEFMLPNPMIMEDESETFKMREQSSVSTLLQLFPYGENACEEFLKNDNIQDFIKSGNKFDLVVMEIFFTECVLGFAYKIKTPVVAIGSFGATDWMGYMVGNPNPYAYVPHPFLSFTCHMNFFERMINTLVGISGLLLHQYYYLPRLDTIMQKFLNDSTFPSLAEIERHTSLLLVNHHTSIGCPKPLVPNMIQVGGMHVKAPRKLSQDLQKFLDESKHGVIYFSMGSNAKSSVMPIEKREIFIKVFSKLEQDILWKWEEDILPGKPSNVKTGKWLPQTDILAHRNVHAFITHGGLLSTQEATARGVPLIGIPLFGDQDLNMNQAKNFGCAIKLEFENVSEVSLEWAIREILTVPSYRKNAKRLSLRFNDRPLPPLDEAVYWTEYVLRHKGALHLRSAALELTWYQYFLLDIVVVLLAVSSLLFLVLYFTIRTLLRHLKKNNIKKVSTSKGRKLTKKD